METQKALGDLIDANGLAFDSLYPAVLGTVWWHTLQTLQRPITSEKLKKNVIRTVPEVIA